MLAIAAVGMLIFMFSLIYLAYHLLKKIKDRNRTLSGKIFYPALTGGLILFIIGAVYTDLHVRADLEEAQQKNIDLNAENEELNLLYTELQKENKELVAESTSANEEIDNLTTKLASSEKIAKDLKEKQMTHDTKSKEFEKEITELKAKNSNLSDEVSTLKDKVASSNSPSVSSLSSNESGYSSNNSVSNPGQSYYQNCTAAKAAGAAPVYSDDPGYGPHLDRDGDGVGCE
ncbi:excalibur calcium-binding domain-containing protein [Sporosarcina sp. P1]|uniref:excalibur calcium-binding domain-containing protein n=1 Tax=Sporosarcina sp. P1 TaxID=2048257 RepID=UPI0018EB424A|nr:excalibur calcium-binding domain-containing protein [Sporosarcina sp. P1]